MLSKRLVATIIDRKEGYSLSKGPVRPTGSSKPNGQNSATKPSIVPKPGTKPQK